MRWPQQSPGDPSTPRQGTFWGAPPLFSPTCSRSAFPVAASAVVSEHPCVTLDDWWLARVEGHERKIAVAGFFERNRAVLDFTAAPIAKCHEPYVLETENGTVLFISGSFNIERTLENGFTIEACEKFSLGFPHWWEKWNVLYPKMMSSQTELQPRSSGTSNSRDNSSRFYLERFQEGKLLDSFGTSIYNTLNNAEAFSSNGAAFPDSSRLPNGTPRFEEYTCDDDTPAIKKSDASNHDSNKVKNVETDLVGASTLKEGSNDGIDTNMPSASMVDCTNDDGHQGTHAASLKRHGCLKKSQRAALNESMPGEDTPTLAYSDVQSSVKGNLSPLNRGLAKSLTVSTPESLKLKKTRSGRVVVPALDPGCQNIVYAPDGSISAIIGLDLPSPLKGSTSKNNARKKNKRTN